MEMKRAKVTRSFSVILYSVILWVQLSCVSSPVLPRIETYKAPAFPKSDALDMEAYDLRLKDHDPIPPTLADVLVCDVWQRVTMDLKLRQSPKEASEDTIRRGINVYLERDWRQIAGYRPWTHWNFIRGLNESQRALLAKEITAHIKEHGVRDVRD
jgi:hypothetical protein